MLRYHDGQLISEADERYFISRAANIYTLVVNNVLDEDAGEYKCELTNKAGKASSTGELIIERKCTAINVSWRSITWTIACKSHNRHRIAIPWGCDMGCILGFTSHPVLLYSAVQTLYNTNSCIQNTHKRHLLACAWERDSVRWTCVNSDCSYIPDSKVHGANMGPIWGR